LGVGKPVSPARCDSWWTCHEVCTHRPRSPAELQGSYPIGHV